MWRQTYRYNTDGHLCCCPEAGCPVLLVKVEWKNVVDFLLLRGDKVWFVVNVVVYWRFGEGGKGWRGVEGRGLGALIFEGFRNVGRRIIPKSVDLRMLSIEMALQDSSINIVLTRRSPATYPEHDQNDQKIANFSKSPVHCKDAAM